MKKRYLFCFLVTILAVGLVFTTCDLLKNPDEGGTQEPLDDLVINGKDADGRDVQFIFSPASTAGIASIASTAKATMKPKTNDTYKIFYGGKLVSSGKISMSGTTVIVFTPTSGPTFTGNYTSGNNLLTFTSEIPLEGGGSIKGFQPVNGGSNGTDSSAAAKAVEADFNSSNAVAVGSTVEIRGPLTVTKNVNIPSGVKLIFNAREDDEFRINNRISVTAKGGIEVKSGRGVSVVDDGQLIVEGNSTISGRLNIGKGNETGTLDIFGTGNEFTIKSGGVLSLLGDETVAKVAQLKYGRTYINPLGPDAVFKLSGSLVVESGGRFQIPDPTGFEVGSITGVIKIKAGGELILVTADPNGIKDLHPLIGVLSTATEGFPVGADYVMDPVNTDSRIEARINSGVPAFELTGSATALGRLIVQRKIANDASGKATSDFLDERPIPYRQEVWLLYPFTVTANGDLRVGNSSDRKGNLTSWILVTGDLVPTGGLRRGVLTNNNKIGIFQNCGIMEWFGGYFNHGGSGKVTKIGGGSIEKEGPYKGGLGTNSVSANFWGWGVGTTSAFPNAFKFDPLQNN